MHSLVKHQHSKSGEKPDAETKGRILNSGWSYDLMEWFFDSFLSHGKLGELRQKTVDLAGIQPGENVLDVGCGTGTLAIKAQKRVGLNGRVYGIDPGAQQIVRAHAKAARRKLPIDFQVGVIEHLNFPDQTFDAVLSTLMMHHIPGDLKRQGIIEIARVLKPGGRLVIADFKRVEQGQELPKKYNAGQSNLEELCEIIEQTGFSELETEEMQFPGFIHALPPVVAFIKAIRN
jgi:ubiquinone/menaquinone biosynthesis C-methylase UbiE